VLTVLIQKHKYVVFVNMLITLEVSLHYKSISNVVKECVNITDAFYYIMIFLIKKYKNVIYI
jgi:hypothetical protein